MTKLNLKVKEEMQALIGKEVEVLYDGKEFSGIVDNFYENDKFADCGLVIYDETPEGNVYKHIKFHRIQKLSVESNSSLENFNKAVKK